MLRHVLFDMELFAADADRENSQKRVLWLLQALTNCNRLYLRQHPDTPLIYQSGIKYTVPAQMANPDAAPLSRLGAFLKSGGASSDVRAEFEEALKCYSICNAGERFREIPRIIENGGGDCDNVASWRAAELRELGIQASPFITWRQRPDGGMTYHVIVLWPDGGSEDPSLLLGMGGADREADRQEELRKLEERRDNLVRAFAVKRGVTVLGARGSALSRHKLRGMQRRSA